MGGSTPYLFLEFMGFTGGEYSLIMGDGGICHV